MKKDDAAELKLATKGDENMSKLKHLQPDHRQPALALIYCGMSLETIEGVTITEVHRGI